MTKHSKDSKKEHKSDHDVKKKEKKDRKEKREKGKISSKHSSSHPYITEQDYFRFMEEFQVWSKTQGIDKHFENLTSDSARDIFAQEFCRAWNKGKLPDMYYQGISSELRRSLGRTSHSWKISLSDADRDRLNDVSDSVRDVTGGLGDLPPWKTLGNSSYSTNASEKDSNVLKMNYMTEIGSGDDTKRHKLQEVRDATRRAKELAEEFSPRALAGSREALLDKRRAVGAATHASFLAKSIDGLPELTDEDIYGGGELHEEARREAIYNPASQRQQRRREEQAVALQQAQHRHQEREDSWKDKLGIDLSRGQKIYIAPRPI